MPRRRKKRRLKPRTPARVRTRKRAAKPRGHQHPELIGLVLAAVGIFLSTVVYLGWSGGYVGGLADDGLGALIGAGRVLFPLACLAVGLLILARSELVDMRPFRTGLIVFTCGLMLTLGETHGGYVGRGLAGLFGLALGDTGVLIVGITTLLAGILLLSGASAGAVDFAGDVGFAGVVDFAGAGCVFGGALPAGGFTGALMRTSALNGHGYLANFKSLFWSVGFGGGLVT
jgi:S-DNA-T family DNA segregation ATPase FtsK/SpoIIIE